MFEQIRGIDIIFIVLILLILYKLFLTEQRATTIEGMTDLSDEAIQNIGALYKTGDFIVTNLTVTGDATINGKSTLKGALDAKNVPSMNIRSLSSSSLNNTGDANINGKLNVNKSTTINGGCKISGKNPTDNNTTLTIINPSTGSNSHFYYGGKDTYIAGTDNIYVRANKGISSGYGEYKLLMPGKIQKGSKMPMSNLQFIQRWQNQSNFKLDGVYTGGWE
jgi:hypothetical protein